MMETTQHFTFLGNGSYSNRGCEAIVRGTAAILRREFGLCRFSSVYMDGEKQNFDKLHETDAGIAHFPIFRSETSWEKRRFSPAWFSRQIRRLLPGRPSASIPTYQQIEQILQENPSRATFLLGGDLATPGAGGSPQAAFKLLAIAREQKSPVIFWGASIGPFSGDAEYEQWMVEQLASINLVCARETNTYQYLQSLGLRDNLRLVADPAFFLQPEPFPLPEPLAALLQEPCIGLNFSPLVGKNYASMEEWKARVRSTLELVAYQYSSSILLIPHVWKRNNNDCEFMQSVLAGMNPERRKDLFLVDRPMNAAQTKWLIGQMQLFGGTRMHATLAAVSSGIPTLFMGYSSKSEGVARDTYDTLDWFIDANSLVPEDVASKIMAMHDQLSGLRAQVQQRSVLFQTRALQAAREVRNILK
jgi:colanic acid/amylovoran biosynthesis protein